MDKQFVHLHLHTDHSLLDGAIKIEPLARRAAELKMPAVAITDHGNLYGSLSFYHKMRDAGVKPIIGIEAYIARGSRHDRGAEKLTPGDRATNHIVLLAKNLTGYHNLVKLSSFAYIEGFWRKPRIDRELLAKYSEGIIGLSACISGVPPHLLLRDQFDEAARASLEFQDILGKGNYYLEIQEHGLDAQKRIRKPLIELSKKTGIPMVATNDSHYLMDTDVKAHDTLLCIGTGKTINDPNRLTYGSPKYYFRSAEEMWETFGEEPDLLLRTMEIAEKCDLEFPKAIDQVPIYPVPDGHTVDSYFEKVTRDGFEERWREVWRQLESSGSLRHPISNYRDRLTHEIETIKRMGYSGYFLIVWDFIRYARDKGIPVGPGRGCLAGDVPIVMADGATKPIAQVKLGDRVRSHTGRALAVTALHRYDVGEPMVRLRCYYGDSIGVTLTGDHKVLAERGVRPEYWERLSASTQRARRGWEEPTGKLDWIPANQLKPSDWVWVPTPKVEVAPLEMIDLATTSNPAWAHVSTDYIEDKRPVNQAFDYSMREVHRHTGVSRNSLRFIMRGSAPLRPNPRHDRAAATLQEYVAPQFDSLDEWRHWISDQSQVRTCITRFIRPDSRFFRILGRWIADGWLRSDDDRTFGLCFHSDDEAGIAEALTFFESLGLQPYIRASKNRKLTQITVRSRTLVAYWRSLFPHYRSTPETKHIPEFVLLLPEENVLDVLAGYWRGDGYVGASQQSKYMATTVSRTLADQVRFLGWRCGIPSSLRRDDRHDDRFHTQPSYVIVMAKDERLAERLGAFPKAAQYCWRVVEGGILLRIREVEEVEGVKEVFDLTVEEDHTYQTSSFAVHNSAAGSLAAYCLKITDVDPIQYDLLFERFLNPERVTMPDIDVDFCVRGRAEVINYVSDLYGRQNVAQIITFGTMASRAVIKDVGRALEMPYAEVEKVAKMIPSPVRGRNVSIDDAIKQNPDLRKAIDTDEKISELIEIARKLEGCARHTSVHAAGVVISPLPIHELVPVCKGQNDELTTQFVMSDLEKTGMLKMDFLALTTLTIIEDCLKSIEREMGERPDLAKIPLDDKPALKLFADGLLNAIFQFESSGMVEICRKLKPEGLEDLSALNALYRPGPLDGGMVDDYIERRHGRRKVQYIVPQMKDTLENTYGICVSGDALVADARTGRRYRLDELESVSDLVVQGVDAEWRPGQGRVLRWVDNGVKPVYRLTLRGGSQVKVTSDHRLLTVEGWRPLCDLRVGDFVATPPFLFGPEETSAATIDRSKLRLLAYLIADGSLTSGTTSDFVSKDPALLEEYRRCLESFDNVRPVFVPQIHGVTRISVAKRNGDDYHAPNSVLAWLRELGLKLPAGSKPGGLSSHEKHVPAFVFELGRDDITFFLASLWDCDGYIGRRLCHYRTISRRLAEDVQTLLLRLGIHSTIYRAKYTVNKALEDGTVTRESYQVTVYDTALLAELLRSHLVSEKRLVACGGREHPTIARAPFLAEVKSASSLSSRALMARYGIDRQHFAPARRKRDRIAAHVVAPLAQSLNLPQTRRQLNVLWEEIVSIEAAGDERVYDLTVEGIHSFVANNVIVHNCVYQEQIMQLAQNLAGYSLGEADLMRRAMGKKKKEEMAKHEEKFISGAVARGIQDDKARRIFTLMAQFADYGFNRSHSFAYAYLAYQTAYLKAHYPTHFYAAVLSNEIANTAKLARYISEMKTFEIELLPPDVNSSHEGFTPVGKAIRFGLAAIKGLGSSAVQMIISAREDGAPFRSIYDFAERVDQRAVNKRVLESLIKSGAFDGVAPNRAAMMAVVDKTIEYGARAQRDKLSGQTGLFADVTSASVEEPALPSVPAWSKKESLAFEKEALGFYASGHPLEDYADAIKGLTRFDNGNIEAAAHGDHVALGGIIVDPATKTTKKGDRFALFRLEDQYGAVKVVCWPEQFNKYKNLLQSDEVVLVRGRLELSDEGGAGATIVVQEIHQLERARSSAARAIVIKMPERSVTAKGLASLGDLVSRHQGSASVLLQVETDDGMTVRLRPQQFFRVNVSPELTAEIEKIGDNWQVELVVGE